MTALWLGLLLAAAAQATDYTIAGVVLDSANRELIPGAQVIIVPLEHRDQRAVAVSDSGGHFSVTGIPAGKYDLTAKRRGFLTQHYDTAVSTGPGLDTEHIVFRLGRPAAISGRVVDEAGEPVEQAVVELFSAETERERRIGPVSVERTDDLGQYRFGSLPPGSYYMAVSGYPWYTEMPVALPDSMPGGPARMGYGVRYYPDASDASAAEPLALRPGQEAAANFTLLPIPAVSVTATFENGQGSTKRLALSTAGVQGHPITVREASAESKEHTFAAVPVGRYTLTAEITDTDPAQYARREIEVGAANLEVALSLRSAASLEGTVKWGDAPAGNLTVILSEDDGRRTHRAAVASDGRFVLPAIAPQRYRISLVGDAYLRDWSVEGARRDGPVLDVAEGVERVRLDLRVAQSTGRIEGVVLGGDRPRPGALVVLAQAAESSRAEDYRVCKTGADGSYRFQDLPAGDYLLFAVEGGADFEYANPAALRPYRSRARRMHVAPGGVYSERLEESRAVE